MKTLALFFALISPIFARVNETVEECRARYGKETETDEKNSSMVFVKAGFTMVAFFDEGRVGFLHVSHSQAKDVLGQSPEISDAELTTFLEANGANSEWTERKDYDFINKTWDTKDGKRIAIYDTIKHTLVIVTQEYLKKMSAKKEVEEKKNLNGF